MEEPRSYENLDMPLDLSQEQTVYEHHRLLRTQDVNGFDAIIYIDEPVEVSKKKVLLRKRGGYLLEIMDYDRLKRVGKKAFSVASGETLCVPRSYLRLKLRPKGGFCIMENIIREMRTKSIPTKELSQEQLLFLATEKQSRRGFLAYVDAGNIGREMLMNACSAISYLAKRR